MSVKWIATLCAAALTAGIVTGLRAAEPAPATPTTAAATTAPVDPVKLIGIQLKSSDDSEQQEAIAKIKEMLDAQPAKAVGPLRGSWLKILFDAKHYAEVLDFGSRIIAISPYDLGVIETSLGLRIQTLLIQGKNEEALADAKRLFNVSSMRGTTNSVLMVSQCLNAVHPKDREVLKRYRREQIAGAKTDNAATRPAPDTLMLANVIVSGQEYENLASQMTGEDYRSLIGRGNLLLLAGKPQDAWDFFERAYSMANEKDLPAATENLARCMKAQDGTVGRANAWIISLRPPMISSNDEKK